MKLVTNPSAARTAPAQGRRRGAILPLLAAMMLIFVMMAAFTVDVAYMQLVRTELRAVVDASAKAGAEALARLQDPADARKAATLIAQRNTVAGRPLLLAPEDIEFGRVTQQPDKSWKFTPGESPFTALRVNGRLTDDSLNGSVPLFFAGVFNDGKYTPVASATAAHMENEIALAIDRSHSMCFDLSGRTWRYASNNPLPSILEPKRMSQSTRDLTSPPHPDKSRWASLDGAVKVFLDEVTLVSQPPRVSLVTWASEITARSYEGRLTGRTSPRVRLDVPLTEEYGPIRTAISNYGQDVMFGGTDIAAGIDEAKLELTGSSARALANKTIVVMTDGQWTSGRNPVEAAQEAQAEGIIIHTVTFLDASDQSLMQQVADVGGGRHYHASNDAELRAVFQEIARSLPVALVN